MTTKPRINIQELAAKIGQLKFELSKLAFAATNGSQKDVHKSNKIRKEIARLLTKIHQIGYGNG